MSTIVEPYTIERATPESFASRIELDLAVLVEVLDRPWSELVAWSEEHDETLDIELGWLAAASQRWEDWAGAEAALRARFAAVGRGWNP